MTRALWLLLGLQLRGWGRYLARSLRTVRGALLALIGLGVFVPWLLAVLFGPTLGSGIEPDQMRLYGPALLVVYCLANVLFSSADRAIYFTPAEVQFLFTGPFTRRQVLLYKLMLTVLVSIPATLFMGAVVRVQDGWWPAVLLGLLFLSMFMQLFSIVLGLLANTIGEQLYSRGRRTFLALAVVIGVGIVYQVGGFDAGWDHTALGEAVVRTTTWRIVSSPLRAFFDVMLAGRFWPDLVTPSIVAGAVLVVLVAIVFALDSNYQEASAAASARIYARMQRLRGRTAAYDEPSSGQKSRFSVPTLPYWGGIGPIFWRQLTTALRGIGRIVWVLFILGAIITTPLLGSGMRDEQTLLPALIGIGAWLSVFLTTLVPYDFRGDIDRIAALKTLPIVPWRLALGQLLTPTLLLTLMQWLALGAALVIAPDRLLVILAVAVYVPAFSFLIVTLENLLFLLFPVRLMAATPGDFQALGRNVLLAVAKMIGLATTAVIAVLVGIIVGLVSGQVWAGVVAAWPVVVLAGLVQVPLVALAFQWFDVGRDTPA